ncbi:MAG: ribosomal-protein-alanine N-acetyltransferase, partial [Gammaproteobacteria bacterium]
MRPEPVPPERVQMRLMQSADLAAVLAIEQAAYAFPWTAGILRDCLRVGYSCWVLQVDGRIRGYVILSVGAGEAHLLNLCVHPEHRRRGYGERLLRHALEVAARQGADTLYLEVRVSNTAAQALYRKH